VFDLWEDPSEAHPLAMSDIPLNDIIAAYNKVCSDPRAAAGTKSVVFHHATHS
jgi:hypothetical protein